MSGDCHRYDQREPAFYENNDFAAKVSYAGYKTSALMERGKELLETVQAKR